MFKKSTPLAVCALAAAAMVAEGRPTPPPVNADGDRVIATWHITTTNRDAGRDNRKIDLKPGEVAELRVFLPQDWQSQFSCNLKHDKRQKGWGKSDRGRTKQISHGSKVQGNAHDWPSFNDRIYLGEQNGVKAILREFPGGFHVQLVIPAPK